MNDLQNLERLEKDLEQVKDSNSDSGPFFHRHYLLHSLDLLRLVHLTVRTLHREKESQEEEEEEQQQQQQQHQQEKCGTLGPTASGPLEKLCQSQLKGCDKLRLLINH